VPLPGKNEEGMGRHIKGDRKKEMEKIGGE